MNVIIVSQLSTRTPPLTYGKGEKMNWNLARSLVNLGHNVILIAGSAQALQGGESVSTGNLTTRVERENFLESPSIKQKLLNADVIIDCSEYKTVAEWAYKNKKKCVSWFTNGNIWLYPRPPYNFVAVSKTQRLLALYNSAGYDGPLFPPATSNTYRLNINEAEFVYPEVDVEALPFVKDPEDYFLWFGRIHPNRGLLTAIDIALENRIKLKVAGILPSSNIQGYLDHCKERTASNSLIEYVSLPNADTYPSENEKAKQDLMSHAKGLILPLGLETGYLEPFSITLIEALAHGVPVFVPPYGFPREVIEHTKDGFLAPSKAHFVHFIENFDSFEVDRNRCHEKALKFKLGTSVHKFVQLLDEVIGGKEW